MSYTLNVVSAQKCVATIQRQFSDQCIQRGSQRKFGEDQPDNWFQHSKKKKPWWWIMDTKSLTLFYNVSVTSREESLEKLEKCQQMLPCG